MYSVSNESYCHPKGFQKDFYLRSKVIFCIAVSPTWASSCAGLRPSVTSLVWHHILLFFTGSTHRLEWAANSACLMDLYSTKKYGHSSGNILFCYINSMQAATAFWLWILFLFLQCAFPYGNFITEKKRASHCFGF